MPVGLLTGGLVATGLGLAARATPQGETLSVADVKAGMTGYGMTVFAGTKPERFDVEVISVLHNFRPAQDLILVKTKHPRLDTARTVAGMSGSPIYLGGKLAGAYAYGWYFGMEPIAGVTPIEYMLADMRRPLPASIAPRAAGAPLPGAPPRRTTALTPGEGNRFAGPAGQYDLRAHAAQLADRAATQLEPPRGTSLAPASTPLLVSGLAPRTLKLATELLEPLGLDVLQAGGGSGARSPATPAPTRFEDGGAITVELVRGDVGVNGLGTVTHVVGDKLVAFGHPMLGGGFEDLPTATGIVHWILATQNRSFKIGEPGLPLGSLVNDRQSAIVVDTKRTAPTFPVRVEVTGASGAPKPIWTMAVASDPFLAPNFLALGIGSALETTTSERVDSTWRAKSRLELAGHGAIELVDFGAGADRPLGPGDFMRSQLTEAVGVLLNNPWETVTIERVDTRVQVTYEREVLRLRGAQVLESEVEPGESAHIRLTLQRYRGEREIRVVELPIPAELANQTVEIRLQPGYEVERPMAAPESVADVLAMLTRGRFDAESVVASYRPGDAAASYHGNVATRLPPGAADTLRSTTQSASPEVFAATRFHSFPIRGFMTGQDTVRVKVRDLVR